MKKFVSALIALSLVTLGLTACRTKRVTFVETSYFVTHPAAHKGDFLVFQVPSASKDTHMYVHFDPASSPCTESTIPVQPGKPARCKVIAAPSVDTRYLFYIDSTPQTKPVGKCPPCWPGTVIVSPVSGPVETPLVPLPKQSSIYPAAEVLIFSNKDSKPIANTASAYPGQPVTWFKNGPDSTGWTVLFNDDICQDGKTITSGHGEVAYCTLKPDASIGPHSYTITVDKVTGPSSELDVIPAPTSSMTSNPQ